jgi:hypothetical protein
MDVIDTRLIEAIFAEGTSAHIAKGIKLWDIDSELLPPLTRLYTSRRAKEINAREHMLLDIYDLSKDELVDPPLHDLAIEADTTVIRKIFVIVPEGRKEQGPFPWCFDRGRLFSEGLRLVYLLLCNGVLDRASQKEMLAQIGGRIEQVHQEAQMQCLMMACIESANVLAAKNPKTKHGLRHNSREFLKALLYEDLVLNIDAYQRCLDGMMRTGNLESNYRMDNDYIKLFLYVYQNVLQNIIVECLAKFRVLRHGSPDALAQNAADLLTGKVDTNFAAKATAEYWDDACTSPDPAVQAAADKRLERFFTDLLIFSQWTEGPLAHNTLMLLNNFKKSTETLSRRLETAIVLPAAEDAEKLAQVEAMLTRVLKSIEKLDFSEVSPLHSRLGAEQRS